MRAVRILRWRIGALCCASVGMEDRRAVRVLEWRIGALCCASVGMVDRRAVLCECWNGYYGKDMRCASGCECICAHSAFFIQQKKL